jgi:hypothetical protein
MLLRNRGLILVYFMMKGPSDPFRSDMHFSLIALCELKIALSECEERVIAAAPNVLAGMDMRSALAHNDIARVHEFTGKFLDTQALCLGITSVP